MRAAGTLLAAIAWTLLLATSAREASVEPPSKWDARLLDLEEAAVEAAFSKQIGALYETWMKDYAARPEHRVAAGARNARSAYIRAMRQIESKRK